MSHAKTLAIVTNNTECERHVQYYSRIEEYFLSNGWEIRTDFDVGLVVICACGFHNFMHKKIQRTLDELRKKGMPENRIVIMGCLTKTHETQLASEFRGRIIGYRSESELDSILKAGITFDHIPEPNIFGGHSDKKSGFFYIKIAEGCLRECTFCVINKVKGKLKSEPTEKILEQFKEGIAQGHRKIFLMAEDTFAYGIDIGTDIITLSDSLATLEPGVELCYGSLHCRWLCRYADGIRSLCRRGTVKQLHVGLQHVNNTLLARMGRATRFEDAYAVLCAIRKECPAIVLSADILVGFHGETEPMFDELMTFLSRDKCFNNISHFGFSDVAGAPSSGFQDKLDPMQIAKRWDRAREVLGDRSYYNREDLKDDKYRQAYIATFNKDYTFCRNAVAGK